MTAFTRIPSTRISAVISDVDGTLVTDDKVLTKRAKSAVAELHAAGIAFCVISARPPRGMLMLLAPLEITTPLIGFNGGVFAEKNLTIITQHLLPAEIAHRSIDLLDAHGAQVWVFSGQDWLLRDSDQPYVALEQRTVGFRPTIVEDFGAAIASAAKIVGVSSDFELVAQCERDVTAELSGHACVVRSQAYYLDVTHTLANKGAALAQLAKLLAIPLTEIAVIGDGSNDVAMFERGGLSIAMGNAKPDVQRAADFVTNGNGDDGFADAIERFIIGGHRSNAPPKGRSRRSQRMIDSTRTAAKTTLVLADVDGTLLTSEKVLTSKAAMAVKDLRSAGIAFAITSGRPPRGMAMLINPLELRTPIAGFNGGVFVKPDLTVIESHTLDPAVAKQTLELILDQGLDAWVYTEAEWLIRDQNAPHVARETWTVKFDARVVASFSDSDLEHAVKIVGVSDDLDRLAACEKAAQSTLGGKASAARSQPYYLDVTHPQANKGTVVANLSKFLDIPPEQIATIGDMPNDVLMFRKSGFSIAMGNSSDEVKAQASAVTESNEDEGFAKAVRKFVLRSVDI